MDAFGLTVCDPPEDVQCTSCLSRPWDAPIALLRQLPYGPGPLVCCRLDALPLEPNLIAGLMLSPGEADFWRSMRAVDKRRHEWLLGRAMGRVLAHELFHVFGNTFKHGHEGAAKTSFSPRELVADQFKFAVKDAGLMERH